MNRTLPRGRAFAACLGLAAGLLACVSVGHEFPVAAAAQLRVGETTQSDALRLFGNPLMTGTSDGNPSWTYARVRYSLFSGATAQYLELEFDGQGRLASYSVNATP